jgi:hypothetical protein
VEFLAIISYMVLGLTVVGVPVISPVRGFILNPAGKEGAEKRTSIPVMDGVIVVMGSP